MIQRLKNVIKTDYRAFAVLILLFLFHGIANYIWLSIDNAPPHNDLGVHLSAALNIADGSRGFADMMVSGMNSTVFGFYPPLFHTVMAVCNVLLGRTVLSSVMANLPFLALLLGALFVLGRKAGNSGIGVLAGFIALMYPYLFDMSRLPLPDFALTAMYSAAVCLLVCTDGFTAWVPSLLLGVVLGLGMLTKQVFGFFIAVPFLYTLGSALYARKDPAKQTILMAASAVLIAVTIAGYWYIPRVGELLPKYIRVGFFLDGMSPSDSIFTFDSFTYYAKMLWENQAMGLLALLFPSGALLWCTRSGHSRLKWIVLLSVLGPYVVFTLIDTKHPKTTVPYLPMIAFVSAAGIYSLRISSLRRVLLLLVALWGVVQYLDASFGVKLLPRSLRKMLSESKLMPADCQWASFKNTFRPRNDDFKVQALLSLITETAEEPEVKVGCIDLAFNGKESLNYFITEPNAFNYYCRSGKTPVNVCVLPRENKRDPDYLVLPAEIKRLPLHDIAHRYLLLKTFAAPDRSSIFVYERDKNARSTTTVKSVAAGETR